jgi:hypothetical protein
VATRHQAEHPPTNQVVLDWIKQRASSDEQMLAAEAKRTSEPGEIVEPEEHDVVTVLTRDHDKVTSLLQQLSAIKGHKKGGTPKNIQRRQSVVDTIAQRLAQHEYAEQEHLWPAVRDRLSDGDGWAAQGTKQEQEGSETLAKLATTDPETDDYDDLVEQLVQQCRKHVAFEDRLFLLLRDVMDIDQRRELGTTILGAKGDA